jgi:hypothetical protein
MGAYSGDHRSGGEDTVAAPIGRSPLASDARVTTVARIVTWPMRRRQPDGVTRGERVHGARSP